MIFLYIHDNTPAQTHININPFGNLLDVLPKKMVERIKMQSAGEKQQFPPTNTMVDDLISSFKNIKALMEFKGKYFSGDR